MKGKTKPQQTQKSQKSTSQLKSTRMRLAPNHSWKTPEGYKIMVLDRGLVSFNIPKDWILAKMEPLEIHDGEPPNDNARISVSFWRLPPGVDWSGLPLTKLLKDSTKGSGKVKILEHGKVQQVTREDIELVWVQNRFLDAPENREAFTRITLARGFNVAVLVSFDFWVDEADKFVPVWEELVRSLQLGHSITDPTKGMVLQ